MRGARLKHALGWRRAQRKMGKRHALEGRPAIHANQHYQRGYREGLAQIA